MRTCSTAPWPSTVFEDEGDPFRTRRFERLAPRARVLDAQLLAADDHARGHLLHLGEAVVPGIAAVARLLGAQALRDAGAVRCAPQRHLVARRDVGVYDDRLVWQRGAEGRSSLDGVLVEVAWPPARKLGARHGEFDALGQRVGADVGGQADLLVRVSFRVDLQHRVVDRRAARRSQLFEKRRLDDLLAGGQHQLEFGAVGHVGSDVPLGFH